MSSGVRPLVTVFATETLDGRLAPPGVGRYRLSCEDDFELQHRLRASSDAVAVGASTVILDNPRLTVRRIPGRNPARVVFDASLKVPVSARVFDPPGRRILITSEGHDPAELAPYRERGVLVLEVRDSDPREALVRLRELGIKRLLVEGGGGLIGSLLVAGLVDYIRVTIAPRVLGDGVPLARISGSLEVRLRLVSLKRLCGSWIHLVYSVESPKWGVWG
ncbi:MAG: dihydrofolate reductase family protein [Desulfurococcales archaeon]|nr:dihydrofolate reductase family protein [Desulfurococcales archaeon]